MADRDSIQSMQRHVKTLVETTKKHRGLQERFR